MTRPDTLPAPAEAYATCRGYLQDYPVIFEQPVSWGEMDVFGHVNNIVYFRYFESARMAYFDRIRYKDEMSATKIGPILAETKCRFRAALEYPDYVAIGARVTDIEKDRFLMDYAVASYRSGGIAAEGTGLVVSYDYAAGAKAPLPDGIVERIRRIESSLHAPLDGGD